MVYSVPLVALVGRPNVGKSTLFNRLTGRRTALVYDSPGVTRDRLFGEVTIGDKYFRLVDTGGLESHSEDPMLTHMRTQTQLAIEEADLVLLVTDGALGLSPLDQDIAQTLRRANKKTLVVVTKLDAPSHQNNHNEFFQLGFDTILGVSGEHGRGIGELLDAVEQHVTLSEKIEIAPLVVPEEDTEEDHPEPTQILWQGGPIHLAVVGRPNAGKSSLINCLLGQNRLLATPIAGTTRDPVDSELVHEEQKYILIDTAGVRRKRSIADKLEQFAVVAAFKSMDRADVVAVVLDATEKLSDQDVRIIAMAHDKGKGLILVANKWDLVDYEHAEKYEEHLRDKLAFAPYAPLLKVSAKTTKNVHSVLNKALFVQQERHKRVRTGELNRFFREVVELHPPPVQNGKRPKLYFVSQPMIRPPTFVFASTRSKDIHFSYQRYLINVLRERYGFVGTNVWLKFRDKEK